MQRTKAAGDPLIGGEKFLMGITYNVRQARGVTVVDLSGRLTLNETMVSESNLTLPELIRDLVKHGYTKILLNLRDVTHLDNASIGELFSSFATVRNRGGVLKLTNPTERVRNLIRLTKLNTVLDVIENEPAAVESFSSSPSEAGSLAAASGKGIWTQESGTKINCLERRKRWANLCCVMKTSELPSFR